MIQPAAHDGNKIFKNPLEIFYTSPKIIPLLPTGAAVGYRKRGRRMFYTKDANGEFVEIGEPVVLETVATDQMTNAFEELTFTFKMLKKDLDKLARVLLPNNWLKMHHYPKRRKVNVRTYH